LRVEQPRRQGGLGLGDEAECMLARELECATRLDAVAHVRGALGRLDFPQVEGGQLAVPLARLDQR
jgi:hypothetical protein